MADCGALATGPAAPGRGRRLTSPVRPACRPDRLAGALDDEPRVEHGRRAAFAGLEPHDDVLVEVGFAAGGDWVTVIGQFSM